MSGSQNVMYNMLLLTFALRESILLTCLCVQVVAQSKSVLGAANPWVTFVKFQS